MDEGFSVLPIANRVSDFQERFQQEKQQVEIPTANGIRFGAEPDEELLKKAGEAGGKLDEGDRLAGSAQSFPIYAVISKSSKDSEYQREVDGETIQASRAGQFRLIKNSETTFPGKVLLPLVMLGIRTRQQLWDDAKVVCRGLSTDGRYQPVCVSRESPVNVYGGKCSECHMFRFNPEHKKVSIILNPLNGQPMKDEDWCKATCCLFAWNPQEDPNGEQIVEIHFSPTGFKAWTAFCRGIENRGVKLWSLWVAIRPQVVPGEEGRSDSYIPEFGIGENAVLSAEQIVVAERMREELNGRLAVRNHGYLPEPQEAPQARIVEEPAGNHALPAGEPVGAGSLRWGRSRAIGTGRIRPRLSGGSSRPWVTSLRPALFLPTLSTSMDTPTLTIATFPSKKSNQPKIRMLEWNELAGLLTEHQEREEKDGRLWSPTGYPEGATRGKEQVERVYCLVLDFDDGIAPGPFRKEWERWEYVLYSTFSHSLDYPKWRAVFPLAAPVAGADWPAVYAKLAASLGKGHTDPSCKDCSRIYYTPSCPPGAPRFAERHTGELLAPDDFPDEPYPDPFRNTLPRPAAAQPAPPGTGDYSTLDAPAWFQFHGAYGRDMGGRQHAVLCPWDHEHSDSGKRRPEESDTVIWEGDGISKWPRFHCSHSHCQGRKIEDVIALWDDASDFCSRQFPTPSRPASLNGSVATRTPVMTLNEGRERCSYVRERIEENVRVAFEPLSLYAFQLVRLHDRTGEWSVMLELFRSRKIVREIEKALPHAREIVLADEDKTQDAEPETAAAGAALPDCPVPNLTIPHPYLVGELMIGKRVAIEGASVVVMVAPAPILITGRTFNPITKEERLRLTWKWKGSEWRSQLVERQQALTIRKLVGLSNIGFPVADISAGDVVEYLFKLETANRNTVPVARITNKLGWQWNPWTDSPFLLSQRMVLPDGAITDLRDLDTERPETWNESSVFFHSESEGQDQVSEACREQGTLEGWLEAIAKIAPFPRVILTLYASFAPVLLQILDVPNFIFELANPTTTGKTTALRVAASVWGNPDEKSASSLIQSWDSTIVGVERISHATSSLPLLMDDTSRHKNVHAIGDVVYLVANGRGRLRGKPGGIAPTAHWHTVMISTGEQPIHSFKEAGGVKTRCLIIEGAPLGDQNAENGLLAQLITDGVKTNHGHAGSVFVSWLLKNRESWEAIREEYARWKIHLAQNPPIPEASRFAEYWALMMMVEILVHQALDLPFKGGFEDPDNPDSLCLKFWQDLARKASDAAGHERALSRVLDWAYSHEHSFIGRRPGELTDAPIKHPNEIAGRWDAGEWTFIAFFRGVLEEILKEAGFNPEAVLTGWREKGWIQTRDPKNFTARVRIPGADGAPPPMVKILRSAFPAASREEIEEAE